MRMPKSGSADRNFMLTHIAESRRRFILSPSTVRQIIAQPGISCVSFAAFGTLYSFNGLNASDVTHLAFRRAFGNNYKTFLQARLAIDLTQDGCQPDVDAIYAQIEAQSGIPANDIAKMRSVELRAYMDMAVCNQRGKLLYEHAVSCGKGIAVLDSLGFSAALTCVILLKCGYSQINLLYSKCRISEVDTATSHFANACDLLHIGRDKILHIGNDLNSDFLAPQSEKIAAIWVPGPLDEFYARRTDCAFEPDLSNRLESMARTVALGLTEAGSQQDLPCGALYKDFRELSTLFLAPAATLAALRIHDIASQIPDAKRILFIKDDGSLLKAVYEQFTDLSGHLPADSLELDSASLQMLSHDSLRDFIAAQTALPASEIINLLFDGASKVAPAIPAALAYADITPEALGRILAAYAPVWAELEDAFQKKRAQALDQLTNQAGVETGISLVYAATLAGSSLFRIDYDAGTGQNRISVSQINPLFCNLPAALMCLYASFFALDPASPTAMSQENQQSLAKGWESAVIFARKFHAAFGAYLPAFDEEICQGDALLARALEQPNPVNLEIARILPLAPMFRSGRAHNAREWISQHIAYPDPFAGTSFSRLESEYAPPEDALPVVRAGIHAHMHHFIFGQELLQYLAAFPVKFDLYLTSSDKNALGVLGNLCNKSTLPNMGELFLTHFPNRGRDVAPWILGMRQYQHNYDLFCHVHAKVSNYCGYGAKWRDYLLDRLLGSVYVKKILALFTREQSLGCMFPRPFPTLREDILRRNGRMLTPNVQHGIIADLLGRMGLNTPYLLADMVFSFGNMYWYRPLAVHQLFEFPLDIAEFPGEPFPLDQTIAHAIERIFPFIAKSNGYTIKMYE